MSRIRSIHPGQWTDEDFVECGPWARLLAISLRNEADDNGVFEWRPTRLKMRLFPVDSIDVAELLDELASRSIVMRFDADGRQYGAIRNFRVFQSPRSPKAEHPISPDAEAFVGDHAGEETAKKRGPGRPRKQRNAETETAEPKSIQQNVENNSERNRSRRGEDIISPSDSSISEPIDAADRQAMIPLTDVADIASPALAAFEAYQALRLELKRDARAIDLTDKRRRQLSGRLADLRRSGRSWADVLAKIRGSPFLRGETARDGKFVAELDWLLKPENLTKVMDGNYDGNPGHTARRGGTVGAIEAANIARARLGIGR